METGRFDLVSDSPSARAVLAATVPQCVRLQGRDSSSFELLGRCAVSGTDHAELQIGPRDSIACPLLNRHYLARFDVLESGAEPLGVRKRPLKSEIAKPRVRGPTADVDAQPLTNSLPAAFGRSAHVDNLTGRRNQI